MEIDPKGYKERIDEARIPVKDYIKQKYPDISEYEEIIGMVYDYESICEEVYMEIGLQCGASLAARMLNKPQISEK